MSEQVFTGRSFSSSNATASLIEHEAGDTPITLDFFSSMSCDTRSFEVMFNYDPNI